MRDRLYRSRDDRVLFGVCGGLADWLDIDPSLVRIVFAVLVITGGIGLLLYIIMALVVPEEPDYLPMTMAPGAGAPTAPGSAEPFSATGPAGAAASAAPGPMGAPTAAAPGATEASSGWSQPSPWMTEREARRAARRAARQGRRAERDGRVGLIFGSILVIVGAWFLVRRYIPALDGDFVGPIVLIAIGAIVLVGALNRNGTEGPGKPR